MIARRLFCPLLRVSYARRFFAEWLQRASQDGRQARPVGWRKIRRCAGQIVTGDVVSPTTTWVAVHRQVARRSPTWACDFRYDVFSRCFRAVVAVGRVYAYIHIYTSAHITPNSARSSSLNQLSA